MKTLLVRHEILAEGTIVQVSGHMIAESAHTPLSPDHFPCKGWNLGMRLYYKRDGTSTAPTSNDYFYKCSVPWAST